MSQLMVFSVDLPHIPSKQKGCFFNSLHKENDVLNILVQDIYCQVLTLIFSLGDEALLSPKVKFFCKPWKVNHLLNKYLLGITMYHSAKVFEQEGDMSRFVIGIFLWQYLMTRLQGKRSLIVPRSIAEKHGAVCKITVTQICEILQNRQLRLRMLKWKVLVRVFKT